ncbi:hypothetical protein [Candidatus Deianiraea vastatrix]|uniref:RiboL-PSP-HEPN domain-containing protein n=1 Tax=Candidatus Deianiraea vastatrix TaxID=2163644 RepID=A0A5B8XC86_9RICK|nr:hypothetical protein [Candidatus Deianiraea vastatrix]QED22948.1 hypothetical protein Deia_00137 [Candidatus Deianiraea vastatrix]
MTEIDLEFTDTKEWIKKATEVGKLTGELTLKDDIDDAFRRLIVICYIEEINKKAQSIYETYLKDIDELAKYFADSRKYYNEHKSYIDVLLFLLGKATYLTEISKESIFNDIKNLKKLRDSFAHFRIPSQNSAIYSLDTIIKQDYVKQTEQFLKKVVELYKPTQM